MKKAAAILAIAMFCLTNIVAAQTESLWRDISGAPEARGIVTDKAVARLSFPAMFRLFHLAIDPLRQELFTVVSGQGFKHSTIISLPNADGQMEQFEVFEASNFEPDLQAQFPEIRAFSGKGITDRYATLKLSISPQGLQTMVFRTDKEDEFMEPYSRDHTVYAVFKSRREKGRLSWVCSTPDERTAADMNSQLPHPNGPLSNTGEIRTMRLAQSCNGEYSNYFGAFNSSQVALVLAAFNATLTRCNGCYEKDLALHLNLIAATTNVIYYDPATDPYTTLSNWNSQLQSTLTSVIGEANYDIGHMFGASGGGGNAGCIGCVCVNGQKGSGITSPADGIPQGDNFDIDYVVHEVGHQLGANHTFTYSNEGTSAQKEVGAGITIMGYAGITSQDPAPHSIDIYHETSIAQIQANLATKTCPTVVTMTANHPPVVAAVGNYTIPITTPFALTGSATDPEGDPLTYCWEQDDNSNTLTGNNSVASPTKASGPNWLSFSPTASPTRIFPKLSTILAGLFVTPPLPGGDAICNIEALSSVSRTLHFRLTVRDNSPYVPGVTIGQTQFTNMTVTVTNTSGPFQVSSPNTNVSWPGGSTQTITWLVNNTTVAPVSCANVKVSLSTDGGQTFPTVLAASTPNDGTEALVIPNTPTTTARIKVEAVGNIFFDISNSNFTITASTLSAPTLVFPPDNATQQPIVLTLRWNTVASATSYRLQVGTDSTFAGGMVLNDSTIVDTTRAVGGLSTNTRYFWRVNAKNGSGTSSFSSVRRFTTVAPPPATTLVSPADNATGQPVSLTLRWNTTSTATSYKLQVASDSTFTSGIVVNDSTITDTSRIVGSLSYSTRYFWRVSGLNAVGTGPSSSTRRFTTLTPPPSVTLVLPPDNATGQPAPVTLRWNAAPTATSYRLQVSTDSTFGGSFVINDSSVVDTSYNVSGLVYGTRYFWRVNGQNVAGMGAASAVRRFTTLTVPPPVTLVFPSDNATGEAGSLILRWNVAPTATSYILHVSTDSTFAGGIVVSDSSLTDTTRTVRGLLFSTRYFWRVSGHNIAGTGLFSTVRRFTTLTSPPVVTLVSPPMDTTFSTSSVTLLWHPASFASKYSVEWSIDSSFASSFVDSTVIDTSTMITQLHDSAGYYWRVKAGNIAGWGPVSSARRFSTHFATTVNVSLVAGWNMISNPVNVANDSVSVLYPGASFPYAFAFASGYVQSYLMSNGRGYWEMFPAPTVQPVVGVPVTRDTLDVAAGWNMIGSVSNPVDTSTIISIPPGLRESSWFGYAGSYTVATQLIPGQAYWVKTSSPGRFVLASLLPASRAKGNASGAVPADELNTLTITDTKGRSQTLYFGSSSNTSLSPGRYDMPPLPPIGGFDARFETAGGGSMVRTHAAKVSGGVEFPGTIQSDAYPVIVTWKMNGSTASYEIADGDGGKMFPAKDMTGQGSITIANSHATRFSVRLADDGQVPKEFALLQNYPNPFNPTTSIDYQLAAPGKVLLRIFDVLGREVATVVNEAMPAGRYTALWDAKNVASGLYFYRIEAGSFTQMKKMLLLK